ncbi:MAG: 5'/3'-nucleotidase SurE [Alphaproteobacteria bacterium]|nr:5'/3'-nucleotidase SurE [Alphaproteobacteria bacterium]
MAVNKSLSELRILITNDDGINSHGVKALERIANSITPDVWVIAPQIVHSGKGFSVTFDNILRVNQLSPRKFSVTGTPADCVFMALGEILKDKKPDLVLSGINHGANIGDFIGISGTIGAVFAAAQQKIKAIAVSQDCKKESELTKFPLVDHFLPKIIKKLMSFEWPDNVCMNVNFPDSQIGDISGVKVAKQGNLDITWNVHKKADPVDDPYYWLHATFKNVSKFDNADMSILENKKYISVAALQCRHDYLECFDKLEELFSSNV